MNFASPYVYDNAADDSYEVVSDEEFKAGMDLSDSGESDDELAEGVRRSEEPSHGTAAVDAVPEHPVDASTGNEAPKSRPSVLGRMMGMLSSSGGSKPPSGPSGSGSRPPSLLFGKKSKKSTSSKLHHWKTPVPGEPTPSSPSKGGRKFRRADTNIVSLRFNTLKKPSTMHAGEVIQCAGCEAIMSNISVIEDDGPDKVWKCEFCEHRNLVEIEEEEKPAADDVTFLIEAALSTATSGTSGRDESMVIFCIDISGSMTITTEVPGHQKLRGSETLRRLRRENTMEGPQRLPSEGGRRVTYISRLQAVQAAVDHQLGQMAKDFPHRRVGLITFSSEVCVIGDGTGEVVQVSGSKLTNQEELSKIGAELPAPRAIKEVRASLGEKVFNLEEGGSTALGPAMVVALSLASRHPGSKVILCTDGKSNEGVGKVENLGPSDPSPDVFFESIATEANAKGVSVSVVTISGTDCKLIQLGKLADSTGGQVNIVDPLKLTEEFSNVLADQIIATNVVATFIVHKNLYIGKEENATCKERREIGNVNADHEISFEFGLRRRKTKEPPKPNPLNRIAEVSASAEARGAESLPTGCGGSGSEAAPATSAAGETAGTDATPEGAGVGETRGEASDDIPSELPFQVQLTYADVDGNKALRVLTQKKPVTTDRNVAERDVDLNVLALHTERRTSELALQGDYTGSRGLALMNQRLGWRSSHNSTDESRKKLYKKVFTGVQTVENTVSHRQQQELRTYGRTHSDDEDEEDTKEVMDSGALPRITVDCSAPAPSASARPSLGKKKKMRSEEVDDSMASVLYKGRAASSNPRDSSKSPQKK